jgi:2'-5' RNA ligase
MPVCVYLEPIQGIHSAFHQFRERLRIEQNIPYKRSSLGPHLTIKAPVEVPHLSYREVYARTNTFARSKYFRPVYARVLAPAEFSIEGSDDTVLYLPFEGKELTALIENVLDFFENELDAPRTEYEGKVPHLTLMKRLEPEHKESVVSVARSIGWPQSTVLGFMVIAHRHGDVGPWYPYERISLAPAAE